MHEETAMARQKQKLTVITDETFGPYIMVPSNKAQALKDYLAQNGIQTTREQGAIRSGGQDAEDVLDLGSADQAEVQKLLDDWTE
jgi:hypothetical protein